MKTIKEKVENTKVNPRYDINFRQAVELVEKTEPFNMVFESFRFGYIQGQKALKAEMKRGGLI